MRILFIILIFTTILSAQSVELSALNYGGNWQERDAYYVSQRLLQLRHIKPDSVYQLYHYRYTIDDSSMSLLDFSQDSIQVIERYYNLIAGKLQECSVELIWYRFSKASPPKATPLYYTKEAGWKGGPWSKQIDPSPIKQQDILKASLQVKKQEVDQILSDKKNKVWKDKDNKTIAAKDKRKVAWQVVTEKISASDITVDGKPIKEKSKDGKK